MALNPNPGVTEQISDQQRTLADQNAAHVAVITANSAAGIQVHKRGAVAGPGSFTAHTAYPGPVPVKAAAKKAPAPKKTAKK